MAEAVVLAELVSPTAGLVVGSGAGGSVQGDVAEGHVFGNNGQQLLVVHNTGASEHEVTIEIPALLDGNPVQDRVEAVAAGVSKILGPFKPAVYNQTIDGKNGQLRVTVDSDELYLQVLQVPRV